MNPVRSSHAALFVLAAVAVATSLFVRFWTPGAISPGHADSPAVLAAGASRNRDPNDPLSAFYRARLGGIMRDLAAKGVSLQAVSETRDEILALRVPEMYREIHLQIVLALARTEDALRQGTDAAIVSREWSDFLQTLSETNPWVAP
mgnify:CR=1 FL=1